MYSSFMSLSRASIACLQQIDSFLPQHMHILLLFHWQGGNLFRRQRQYADQGFSCSIVQRPKGARNGLFRVGHAALVLRLLLVSRILRTT